MRGIHIFLSLIKMLFIISIKNTLLLKVINHTINFFSIEKAYVRFIIYVYRQPRLDTPDAEAHADKTGEQRSASMRSEDAAHVAGSGGAGGGGGAVLSGQSEPEGGWDLILCSFAFAEKDVAGGSDVARHLKEVCPMLRRARVHEPLPLP